MAQNSTNRITIVVDVIDTDSYEFSPQDDVAAVSQIPDGGVILFLPDGPSNGDTYSFADVDGTCSAENPITLMPGDGTELQSFDGGLPFDLQFSAATAVFDAETKQWFVSAQAGLRSGSSDVQVTGPSTGIGAALSIAWDADHGEPATPEFGSETGLVRITAQFVVLASATALPIQFQITKNGTGTGQIVEVVSGADANHVVTGVVTILDDLGDSSTALYGVKATAPSGQTVASGQNSSSIILEAV